MVFPRTKLLWDIPSPEAVETKVFVWWRILVADLSWQTRDAQGSRNPHPY